MGMGLHSLLSVTIGVPNVEETSAYYAEFGLGQEDNGWFSTRDLGRQLRIVSAPTRRLLAMHVGVDDADDLARAAERLGRLGVTPEPRDGSLMATEPVSGMRVTLDVTGRPRQDPVPATGYNGPGRTERIGDRAPAFGRTSPVRPRKLGHAVLASTDYQASVAFFADGIGFRVSDRIKGAG